MRTRRARAAVGGAKGVAQQAIMAHHQHTPHHSLFHQRASMPRDDAQAERTYIFADMARAETLCYRLTRAPQDKVLSRHEQRA